LHLKNFMLAITLMSIALFASAQPAYNSGDAEASRKRNYQYFEMVRDMPVDVTKLRNYQYFNMVRDMPVDVTKLRNYQYFEMIRDMPVDLTKLRNLQYFNMSSFVPTIEVGECTSYKIGSNVFGFVNLTSQGGFSNCTVEFQIMAPDGNTILTESQNASLLANIETPVIFTLVSEDLPLGCYYSRFIISDWSGSLILDTGWFFGFYVKEPIFVHDFGTLKSSQYEEYVATPAFLLNRGEEAIFNFSLSDWVQSLDVRVKGKNFSDFIVEVGNRSYSINADFHLVNGSSSVRIYNAPIGNYSISLNTASLNAEIEEISIETYSKSTPTLWQQLSDEVRVVDKVEGLCGTSRVYSLEVGYYTNTSECLELTVTNTSTSALIHNAKENATLFQLDHKASFNFDIDFPENSTTNNLTFNLTLTETKESIMRQVELIAKKAPYELTLKWDVETTYYRVPAALSLFERSGLYPVEQEELEALDVSDVQIIDIGIQDGNLKNVTINFEVRNRYVHHFLWMTAYTYYDLYIYPVSIGGKNHQVYKSVVLYNEHENVVVSGIPVTYEDGTPTVYFYVQFEKSYWANIVDWICRHALKLILPPGSALSGISYFTKAVMEFVNVVADYLYLEYSADDLNRALEKALMGSMEYLFNERLIQDFGTSDVSEICKTMKPFSLFMHVLQWEDLPLSLWKLGGNLIRHLFTTFRNKPEIFYRILRDVHLAMGVDWRTAGVISLEKVKEVATSALFVLNAAEALYDCVIDVLFAPDFERKDTTASFNDPVEGEFSNIQLGDPLLSIEFSGNVSQSILSTARLYSIDELWLNVFTNDSTASYTLGIIPSSNYTGTLTSSLSDPNVRSSILSYFGIITENTTFILDNNALLVEGTGFLQASFKEFSIHIANSSINGYMEQPFSAAAINDTWNVNLSMIYPFGRNLAYKVDVILPKGSTDIQVLSDGNYTINDNQVRWSEPIDQILLEFTIQPWTGIYSESGGHPIVDFAAYNGQLYAAYDNSLLLYNGTGWEVIFAPTYIISIEPYEDKLIVGGQGGLYFFNGTDFTLIFPVPTYIKPLGIHNNTLYAGTLCDSPPTLYYCNGTCEDPSNWHIDSGFAATLTFSGPFGSIDSFTVYNNRMYIDSRGTIYSFNGTDWSTVKIYDDVYAYLDMQVFDGKLYSATRDAGWRKPMYQGGTGFSGRVIEYDGENWTTILDHGYWIFSLETYNSKLYAGTANKIFTYNGTHWETSFSSEEGAYYAISLVTFDGKIYAGMGNGHIFVDPSPEAIETEIAMIPEFPSAFIMPILMVLTLFATVFVKRKKGRA
jgi:hypothetical protein